MNGPDREPHLDPHPTHQPPPGTGFMNTVRWVLFGGLTLLAIVSIASWVAWRVDESRTSTSTAAAARRPGKALYR
ncbi:MAG TPA: hypothetical protein VNM39_10135, partial [Verrucomicrobiae bacterium]|nr:hypothetical protein [Verrucomicrobiae bacterium]